jgi:pimeloyl-ACP methyl ester carboxylesterase
MNFLHKVRESAESLFGSSSKPESSSPNVLSRIGKALRNPKQAIYQARLDVDGRQEEVLGDAHRVSNEDIIMEQLAHAGAYGKLDPDKLEQMGYREAGAVDDPESGFRAVLYVPNDAPKDSPEGQIARAIHGGEPKPVLSFRGTSEKRAVADDANREGVGTYQFSSNMAKVQGLLDEAGGKCIVTGHSLGGALAQMAAATFPEGVSRIVTFQSPGVDKETADKLKKYNDEVPPEDRITSTHHRAEGDLVPMSGLALTEGDVFTYESVGIGNPLDHSSFPLARLAAARGNLVPGVQSDDKLVRVVHSTTAEEKSGVMPRIAEAVRKTVGGIVRDDSMESYVRTWGDVQAMAQMGQFTPGYIRGVIRDSDRLTDIQKDKMVIQFGGLYD